MMGTPINSSQLPPLTQDNHDHTYINEEVAFIIHLVLRVALTSIFGIGAGIINIIIFIKQGAYKEYGTVSLLGLSVSDLFVVVTMLYVSVGHLIARIDPPNLSWDPYDVVYLTGGWPHLMAAQITRTVTAYVAFERCVSVVFPFKVKTMLPPKRSLGIIAGIFLCFMISFSPAFIAFQLEYRFIPYANMTRLVLVRLSPDLTPLLIDLMWYTNSIIFNCGSVIVVLICTCIMVAGLKQSKEWLTESGSASESKPQEVMTNASHKTSPKMPKKNTPVMSNSKIQKEKRLIVMMITICVMFLFCYIPDLMYLIMSTINSEITPRGKSMHLARVMYTIILTAETINSSINIFIYYTMSARYKEIFNEMFGISNDKQP